ncbi:MAG: ParB/RepB/Spo0J family partition protein [Blastocatellia bacterium]|nr:ParB/RepB/Spo0J family partition protein [Blastocatellia bacterium]MBK6428374.1 ParB/RepB/Spo0J family partition protein [Blastocatellia bacterium]
MSKRGLPTDFKLRHDQHYVEQLATRSAGAPIGRLIPIDRLEPNPGQPRVEIGDLTDLIASIKSVGVLEPLLVRPAEIGGRFMIISGERRYRASLAAGLAELPCIEMHVDDRTVAEIALIENLQRKDLTPFEEAEGLEALATRYGYTHELIAQRIGKSRSTITEALSIATLPADVKDLCRRADISSKSLLLQVVRLKDATQQRAFVERIRNQGMTRDEARAARKPEASTRPRPYEYRFQPVSKEFSIQLRFKRSQVTDSDLAAALRTALGEVEARLGSKRTRS